MPSAKPGSASAERDESDSVEDAKAGARREPERLPGGGRARGDTCEAVGVGANARGCRVGLGARRGEGCAPTSRWVAECGANRKFKRLL